MVLLCCYLFYSENRTVDENLINNKLSWNFLSVMKTRGLVLTQNLKLCDGNMMLFFFFACFKRFAMSLLIEGERRKGC